MAATRVALGLIALAAAGPGPAQDIVMQPNLSLPLAKALAEATQAACRAKGFRTTVAVVDRAGALLVLLRDEAATVQTVEVARRKAYTARMFRRPSAEWAKETADNPVSAPQREMYDVIALGGGVPIKVGEETIGGVASSGATQIEDDLCAKAGLAAVADRLR